jgi:hypothetical protein
MSEEDSIDYKQAFVDIARGYSEAIHKEQKIFIKHFNLFDQSHVDTLSKKVSKRYQKSGLRTQKEILEEAAETGEWTLKQEDWLQKRQQFLKTLENTIKTILIPSQVEMMEKRIAQVKEEIQEKSIKKQLLLNESCETFTERKVSDLTIGASLYTDKALNELFFSESEFDDLEREEIYQLVKTYNDAFSGLAIDKIKALSLSGMFSNYFSVCEDSPYKMFDKMPMDLTFFQLNLLNYGQVFRSIFKNIPNIPDEIKNDPNKLLQFAESGHKKAEKVKQIQAKGNPNRKGAQSIVGASSEDLETMGYDKGSFTSPAELMKKAGKKSMSTLGGDF